MKLSFLQQGALDTPRGKLKTNVRKYMNPTNDWISDFFDGQSPFLEYKKKLMTLHWICLVISQIYMYGYGISANNYRNTLLELWWVGRLTYDDTKANPFELIDVLKRDFITRVNDLLYSNMYTANPMICRSFLPSVKFYEDRGASVNGEIFRKATQYLNVLGGIYILDYFDEEVLTEKITREIYRLFEAEKTLSTNKNIINVKENIKEQLDNNGLKTQIKMAEIIVDIHKFHTPPSAAKINALIEYYQKNKTLEKPIVVSKVKNNIC